MSGFSAPLVPPPVSLNGPVRDGEGDVARTINTQPDLGASDGPGKITSLSTVTVTIARQDGSATTASDVSLLPGQFSLDSTGYLLTIWFSVPAGLPFTAGASTIAYIVTVEVDPTSGGQGWKRDFLLTASALLG